MLSFTTGDSVTFRLTIANDIDTSVLGTPTVVLSQDSRTVPLEIISVEGRIITCELSRGNSLLFVSGVPTYIQQSWNDGAGGILIFPEHEVEVLERFNEIVPDTSIDTDVDYNPSPEVYEIDEVDFDEGGNTVVPFSVDTDSATDYDTSDDAGGDNYDPND